MTETQNIRKSYVGLDHSLNVFVATAVVVVAFSGALKPLNSGVIYTLDIIIAYNRDHKSEKIIIRFCFCAFLLANCWTGRNDRKKTPAIRIDVVLEIFFVVSSIIHIVFSRSFYFISNMFAFFVFLSVSLVVRLLLLLFFCVFLPVVLAKLTWFT